MTTDAAGLHSALVAKVTEYLRLAEAATAGPWNGQANHVYMDGREDAVIGPYGKPGSVTPAPDQGRRLVLHRCS